uniref:Unannotated protein n=1 Tax=freshwater metagenome TaxID=449393 RepID=A0A6J7PUP9_9ZZZZ
MSGDDSEADRHAAVCYRDAGRGGYCYRRCDAGNNRVGNLRCPECLGLLAAAPEHKRIPALQAHHLDPLAAEVDKEGVDVFLWGGRARTFAHIDELGSRLGKREDRRVGQSVVNNDVGSSDEARRSDGEELRVAGSGAHEVHGHFAATSAAPIRSASTRAMTGSQSRPSVLRPSA